jgi:aminoglycoside phosphotransferase (APT) family kinase protein
MASPVAVGPDFAERLARAAGPGVTVRSVEVMPGGHSGLTHRVELDGAADHEVVVVKSTPPGRTPRGRHDVLRQARIMRTLESLGDVPVPTVLFESADGPPFFASACVPGEAVDPAIAEDSVDRPAAVVTARWQRAAKVLADLHRTDLVALRVTGEPARQPREELELWCATMTAARMDDDPVFVRLREAMLADVAQSGRVSVVHGDFRLGNILFEGPEPNGVIDWEIWSVGDPLVDLGWFVQFTDADNFPGVGRPAPGTPSAAEVIATYRDLAGENRAELSWFIALGALKLAAIQAHNRRRHLDGRFHDPYQALLGPAIARHLQRGLHTVLDKPFDD